MPGFEKHSSSLGKCILWKQLRLAGSAGFCSVLRHSYILSVALAEFHYRVGSVSERSSLSSFQVVLKSFIHDGFEDLQKPFRGIATGLGAKPFSAWLPCLRGFWVVPG